MDRAALIGRLNGVMLMLFDSWVAEDDEVGKGEIVRARETVNDEWRWLEAYENREVKLREPSDADRAALIREVRENCQCFQRPTFADPPCAMCKAASTLEADAKKEAALKALCDDLGIGLARLVSGIRAIYGWNAKG